MEQIAGALQDAGYSTFVPHRDGLELTVCVDNLVSSGLSPAEASQLMGEAIFALDVYQVLVGCDFVVANLNGRVPDEGTVSEAAMAWARGKAIVGYKSDSRTAVQGQDNPLVAGLFAFKICRELAHVVDALERARAQRRAGVRMAEEREREIEDRLQLGEAIWTALQQNSDLKGVAELLLAGRRKQAASA